VTRESLVCWIGWLSLLVDAAVAFALSAFAAQLGVLCAAWPRRRLLEGSWIERARHAYPVRRVSRLGFALPLAAGVEIYWAARPRALGPPAWLAAAFAVIAAYAAALLVFGRAERRILGMREPLPGWWRRFAAHSLALRPFWLIVLPIALAMPPRLGGTAALLVAFAALGLYRCTCGDGLRLAARLGLVAPGPARLVSLVARVGERMGRARPAPSYVMPSLYVGAFALPAMGAVVVTNRLLDTLDDQGLEAILAHELGHLSESPRTVALRSAAVVPLLPIVALKAVAGAFGWWPALAGCLVVALFSRLQLRWVRRLETRADTMARAQERTPGAYAGALARSYEANLIPVVARGSGATHPHLYDRLVAAGVPPSYPRPRPPSFARSFVALVVALSVAMLGWTGMLLGQAAVMRAASQESAGEGAVLLSLALTGGDTWHLDRLGFLRGTSGDWPAAARLFHRASARDPEDGYAATMVAFALERAGQCPEAKQAYGALGREQMRSRAEEAGVSEDLEPRAEPVRDIGQLREEAAAEAGRCPLLAAH
jgi:Zn-dependent protease with chaperone function